MGKEIVANIPHFTLDQEYYPRGAEQIRVPLVQPLLKGLGTGVKNGLRETGQGMMYPLHVMNGISDEAMEAASPDYIRDDGKVFGDVVENLFWSNQAAHKSQQNEFAKEMEALGGMEKAVGLRAYALGNTLPKKAAEALDPTLGFFQGFAQEFGKDYLGKSEKGVDESEAAWESLKSAVVKTAFEKLTEKMLK